MDQHQNGPHVGQKVHSKARADVLNVTRALQDRRRLLKRLRRPGHTSASSTWPISTGWQRQQDNSYKSRENHRDCNFDPVQPSRYGEHQGIQAVEQPNPTIAKFDHAETQSFTWYDDSDSLISLPTTKGSVASFDTTVRRSLLPVPLDLKKVEQDSPETVRSNRPSTRVYGGARSKIREHFGANDVQVDLTSLESPVSDADRGNTEPQVPPKIWRSSLKRVSLTPSEMPYPLHLIREHDAIDHRKAKEMLGLRRHSQPPPVPPKDRKWIAVSDAASSMSLPLYGETVSETVREPLNGRTAKLHSITAMLIVFNTWGLCNAFGLFQAYYARAYLKGSSPSTVSWIGSVQLALVFGLGVPVGRFVDKGYFRAIFHGGTAILIFGVFCSATCTKFWQLLLVQGFITGLGMGMVVCAGIVALMTWWDEYKIGRAMGLAAAGSCVGGITYVALARHLLERSGLRTTMLVIGAVVTVGTFIEPSYLLAAAGMFFSFLGVYFGFVYMISFASTELHLSDTASTNLFIFMLAANLPGRFLPALISDRCIGPLNTLIPSVLLSSAIIWLWAVSGESKSSLTVITCFYGFASAGIQVLYAPTVYAFCLEPAKSNSSTEETQLAVDRIGLKVGMVFSAIGVGCLIGLPIGGALITYRTSRGMSRPYLGAQVFAGVCLLLGGFLLLSSRVAKAGWAAKRV